MKPRMFTIIPAALAAVLALLVSTTVLATSGPVTFDEQMNVGLCTDFGSAPTALGTTIDYTGNKTIVITAVEPINPVGVEILSVNAMPYGGDPEKFGLAPYPPADRWTDAWENREDGIGFTFSGTVDASLVTELRSTGEHARANLDGLLIRYTANGAKFSARSGIQLTGGEGDCG
ncbi:hypothetical protein [Salinibacterium sp. SWN1162]|uniref:hypothetical protein n=1 Tax=Salinibacterium sp. SWN1162 TaxID=2792053 RepID=UPI0018CDDAFF|nr:hypothetical protein [Salinibacterium sp. SWN1162]MBH0008094.1 hypothetical protein [Salinibacterium sp. SWN1162]